MRRFVENFKLNLFFIYFFNAFYLPSAKYSYVRNENEKFLITEITPNINKHMLQFKYLFINNF